MFPVLLTLGPLEVSTYGVIVAAGWLAGVKWLVSRRSSFGMSEDAIWNLVYWAFGGAFAGGKLMYFLVTPGSFALSLAALRYGFVFYGWGLRAGLPMHELSNYAAHKDRMLARPAVQRVLDREGVSLG